jgi:drug/metabolite transporter (DMT)-like permease
MNRPKVAVPLPVEAAPRTLWIVLAFATVYIVWGSTYLAIAYAVKTMPPFLMAGTRFLIAGGLLYVFTRRHHAGPLTWANWRAAIITGTLMLLGGNGLVCWAEQIVPSGIAATLIASAPVWFVMLEWLVFGGARPSALLMVGVAVGLAGVMALVRPWAGGGEVDFLGGLALLAACFFWAMGSLYSRRSAATKATFLSTAMQMIAGGVAQLMFATLVGEWARVDIEKFSVESIVAFLYLLVFGSIVAFSAYVWLLKVCSPSLVSTYAFVNPLIAVALGALIARESLSSSSMIAMAIIVVGVMTITLAPKPTVIPAEKTDSEPETPERGRIGAVAGDEA